MLHVVLVAPEIPPNTGNVIRLCANTGATLHLVEPLGFELDDAKLRRAGLDYHEYADVRTHRDFDAFLDAIAPKRWFAYTTRATRRFDRVSYAEDDALVFGRETEGLPTSILERLPDDQRLRLPMRPGNRSINLSNAVAVAVYEAWRQLGYSGSA